jgi:hypothetical protein
MLWQALCGLVLFGVTWRLWWPGSGFPQIPWCELGRSVPTWIDALACIVLAGSLMALILSLSPTIGVRIPSRVGVGERAGVRGLSVRETASSNIRLLARLGGSLVLPCGVASLGILVAIDQHRLQPWVWQMLLWCVVFFASPRTLLWCLRWLTVSVYFWSGVSKLDHAFPREHGRLLLDGLTRALGIDTRFWSPETLASLAKVFPWGELLVAIWLGGWMLVTFALSTDRAEMLPSLRWPSRMLRAGCWGAIAMHLVLLLIVGPLGLNHEPAVLMWNIFFIGQAWLLFGRRDTSAIRAVQSERRSIGDRVVTAFTLIAIVFPVGSFWGWCDHWPAWSVYSSRPAIVEVWIDADAAESLPPELKACLAPAPPLETRREFHLDAWSYRELSCPLYPQERYRLALAKAFIDRHGLSDDAMVRIQSSPDWWKGERQAEELNAAELRDRLGRYRWNTDAR